MIKQEYEIKAPIEKVWHALVDPKVIEQWSGAPAEMSDQKDADFKLWNGDVWGKNTLVKAPTHLEQDWYGGKWPKPSKLCVALAAHDGNTHVMLIHSDVPGAEEKNFADGWRDYYFGPLKKLLEDQV